MNTQPNTPASRNEEVAAALQTILADACDSESETNVSIELYRRGVEALAASRNEQAAPSVTSGAVLDVERLGVPTLESELRFMHENNPLEGYKGSTLWHRVEAALAAPSAAIAARGQEVPATVLTEEDMQTLVDTHGFTGDFEEMAREVEALVLSKLGGKPYWVPSGLEQEVPAASAEQPVLQMCNNAFSDLAMAFPDAMKLRKVGDADRAVLGALASREQEGSVADELLAFVKKIANGEVKDHMFTSLEDEASSLWFRSTAQLALARKS